LRTFKEKLIKIGAKVVSSVDHAALANSCPIVNYNTCTYRHTFTYADVLPDCLDLRCYNRSSDSAQS
jgi:hypothetical protein